MKVDIMDESRDATYKTGGGLERSKLQDIIRGEVNIDGIAKSTNQGMDQGGNRMRGSDRS